MFPWLDNFDVCCYMNGGLFMEILNHRGVDASNITLPWFSNKITIRSRHAFNFVQNRLTTPWAFPRIFAPCANVGKWPSHSRDLPGTLIDLQIQLYYLHVNISFSLFTGKRLDQSNLDTLVSTYGKWILYKNKNKHTCSCVWIFVDKKRFFWEWIQAYISQLLARNQTLNTYSYLCE